jgi:hypothetical protein
MGKAAENERIKLRATFYNNVGAVLFATGCAIPFLKLYEASGLFNAILGGRLSPPSNFWESAFAIILAMLLGFGFRHKADRIMRQLPNP